MSTSCGVILLVDSSVGDILDPSTWADLLLEYGATDTADEMLAVERRLRAHDAALRAELGEAQAEIANRQQGLQERWELYVTATRERDEARRESGEAQRERDALALRNRAVNDEALAERARAETAERERDEWKARHDNAWDAVAAKERDRIVAEHALGEAQDTINRYREKIAELAMSIEDEIPHCWRPTSTLDLAGNVYEDACGRCGGCRTMSALDAARALLSEGENP